MLLSEAMILYLKKLADENSTTLDAYKGKVKKYVKSNTGKDVYTGFSEKDLREFIFKDDQKCSYKFYAISDFYEFVQKEILSNEELIFPITISEVKKIDKEREGKQKYKLGRKHSTVVYLPDDFDFKLLFDDEYYSHLNNKIAEITIKAVIGLGLSTGFDSQHFFKNNTKNYIRLSDVTVNSEEINIVHISDSEFISQIRITGEYCKYLADYVEIRKNHKTDDNAFFIKMWSGYELNHDPNITSKMPSDVQNLVLYFLKHISHKLNIPTLHITDLRFNMVYHYLLNTKGSALNEIIRLYGFPTFVQSAFKEFISRLNDETYYAFDFFSLASSSSNGTTIEVSDDEAGYNTVVSIFEKRIRNTTKVKKVKKIYDNNCQICNKSITLLNEFKYSEVHHIQPMGEEHKGADELHNMMVLCPNHHKLFDLGVIGINPINPNTLMHIDKNNALNSAPITLKHNISNTCIRYHYENIFLPLKNELNL